MEAQANKNSNSVVSFLHDRLGKCLKKFPNIKTVVLMSDSAGGQNRNATVLKYCSWFSKTNNLLMLQLFPVRGHSFSQCDRNFGIVRNFIKKKEVIGSAKPWLEAIALSRTNPSNFEVLTDRIDPS